MGSVSPDLEAAGPVSPDPFGAGSISPDLKAAGFSTKDTVSVSPDGDPYRRQPLLVQAYGPGSKL